MDFDPLNFSLLGNKQSLPGGIQASSATWSNSQPDIIYAVGGCCDDPKLYEVNTGANPMTVLVIKDFTNEPNFQANDYFWQLSVSENDDVFAFTHKRHIGDASYFEVGHVAYKRSTDQILYNSFVIKICG